MDDIQFARSCRDRCEQLREFAKVGNEDYNALWGEQKDPICRISPELFKHDLSDECCSLLTDVAQRLRQY